MSHGIEFINKKKFSLFNPKRKSCKSFEHSATSIHDWESRFCSFHCALTDHVCAKNISYFLHEMRSRDPNGISTKIKSMISANFFPSQLSLLILWALFARSREKFPFPWLMALHASSSLSPTFVDNFYRNYKFWMFLMHT